MFLYTLPTASQMKFNLEPSNWHVANAVVDFLAVYNWNSICFFYNRDDPSSLSLLKDLQELEISRSKPDSANFFEFVLITINI
ncbi:unnamed protein product [Protopolystoma xenopodis]|uniref:Receptor ligand binding region domain-containing protein n=1 Tax=Protopolystoma xenopodis TaxID=117903 RepID=A0A3S5A4T3_9PLAT|nr:unnamed protein product [Protopolystoma xenopodis]